MADEEKKVKTRRLNGKNGVSFDTPQHLKVKGIYEKTQDFNQATRKLKEERSILGGLVTKKETFGKVNDSDIAVRTRKEESNPFEERSVDYLPGGAKHIRIDKKNSRSHIDYNKDRNGKKFILSERDGFYQTTVTAHDKETGAHTRTTKFGALFTRRNSFDADGKKVRNGTKFLGYHNFTDPDAQGAPTRKYFKLPGLFSRETTYMPGSDKKIVTTKALFGMIKMKREKDMTPKEKEVRKFHIDAADARAKAKQEQDPTVSKGAISQDTDAKAKDLARATTSLSSIMTVAETSPSSSGLEKAKDKMSPSRSSTMTVVGDGAEPSISGSDALKTKEPRKLEQPDAGHDNGYEPTEDDFEVIETGTKQPDDRPKGVASSSVSEERGAGDDEDYGYEPTEDDFEMIETGTKQPNDRPKGVASSGVSEEKGAGDDEDYGYEPTEEDFEEAETRMVEQSNAAQPAAPGLRKSVSNEQLAAYIAGRAGELNTLHRNKISKSIGRTSDIGRGS